MVRYRGGEDAGVIYIWVVEMSGWVAHDLDVRPERNERGGDPRSSGFPR